MSSAGHGKVQVQVPKVLRRRLLRRRVHHRARFEALDSGKERFGQRGPGGVVAHERVGRSRLRRGRKRAGVEERVGDRAESAKKAIGKTIGDDDALKEEKKRIYVKPPDAQTLNMAQQAANRNRRNMLSAKREKRERLKKPSQKEEEAAERKERKTTTKRKKREKREEKEIKDLIANETKNWDGKTKRENAKIVSESSWESNGETRDRDEK